MTGTLPWTAGWTGTWASQRGGAHRRRGLPNQDAATVEALATATPGLVAAVADGHGGAQYVRSDVGARIAVEVACATVRQMLAPELGRDPHSLERFAARVLIPALVERWAASAHADLSARAFTAEETARATPTPDADPLFAYGTTLLVAVCWEEGVLVMRLGDGDIVAVDPQGLASEPLPRDARLTGGATTSLCMPDAAADFTVAHLGDPSTLSVLLLATDGYANAFADPHWRTSVGRDLVRLVEVDGPDVVARAWPGWLEESAEAGGDDVTIAMLVRRGRSATTPAWLRSRPSTATTRAHSGSSPEHSGEGSP